LYAVKEQMNQLARAAVCGSALRIRGAGVSARLHGHLRNLAYLVTRRHRRSGSGRRWVPRVPMS